MLKIVITPWFQLIFILLGFILSYSFGVHRVSVQENSRQESNLVERNDKVVSEESDTSRTIRGRVTILLDSSEVESLSLLDSLRGGDFTLIVRDYRTGEGKEALGRIAGKYKIDTKWKNKPSLVAVVHNGTQITAIPSPSKSNIMKALQPCLVWTEKQFAKAIKLGPSGSFLPYSGSVNQLVAKADSGELPDGVIFVAIDYPHFEGVNEARDISKLLNEAVSKMIIEDERSIPAFGDDFVSPLTADELEDSRMANQYFIGSVSVLNLEPDFISLSGTINAYFGGAHQIFVFPCRNINLRTQKDISFAELFRKNFASPVEEYGKKLLNAESYGDLEFFIPDNFNILIDGIDLVYQIYDFGGFGAGPISLTMSDQVLKKYYKPTGLLGYRTGSLPSECN